MAVLTHLYSAATRGERKAKVIPRAFGDNYTQRVRKGLNNMPRVWNLVFADMSTSKTEAVMQFFTDHDKGQAFDWTPPIGAAGRWYCSAWSADVNGYDKRSVTATLTEDFAP
jgi:phage-related protein